MKFLRDLFMGIGNFHWDLGRIMSFLALLPVFVAVAWNIYLKHPFDFMSLGTGIAAIISACAILIAAKDVAGQRGKSE